ncbi:MAG TPA: arginine--tRNA ligase [Alphaproteobacteria bacterium]|nr:arginine--tRNA ligase [Alphaproteobacteria bacterium]USO06758.1 MAG: arginine--tRNA ligase [Rhodospirillales bacterium]HOO81501.1 arginine--tRNA ligase [Alphaproteobacteria bacterium]
MTSLAEKLSDIVGAAFERQGLPVELGVVRVSDRPDLCQFQCNGAMAAAKFLKPNNADGVASGAKKNPREVAQAVVEALSDDETFSKIEIAGPGFINLNVTDEFLAVHLAEVRADERLGVAQNGAGQTVILDYGGPNIAKPMHVGHLRSSIIGDALRRMMKAAGYQAIGDVHMGDWGTPMGMILSELEIIGHDGPVSMEQLAEIYPKASGDCKADEARMELARAATKRLQDGDETYTRKWRQFIDISIEGMRGNFDALGVHFDEWKGESDAHPFIAAMIEDLKAGGWAVESDGAWVVPVEREDDKKEMPPLILLKKDGAVLYGTTDLATIIDRVRTHNPDKIVYVVDQRQSLHFEQVFRAAEKGGLVQDGRPELSFAGFGTMNGADGKPFKTRAGGVMRLEDLIAMGVEKARARLEEANLAVDMDEAEREEIAHKVALAAIKFADLQNQRQSDYVFDLDRMTSFEGKTGPYLLYQAVRIQSLLRKAGDSEQWTVDGGFKIQNEDRALALLLGEMADHFELALKNTTPHVLCDYAYRLAQAFSSFYGNCHILSEEDEVLRASRLALCALMHRQLVAVLGMLGITVPERM